MSVEGTKNSNKSKARRKKKVISKHILHAEERKRQTSVHGGNDTVVSQTSNLQLSAENKGSNKERRSIDDSKLPRKNNGKTRINAKVKDPADASSYLSAWQHRGSGGGSIDVWKFNKNTQSWLIRHMYEPEKVSKSTFAVFLKYLDGLKGICRSRVLEDAKRRALRYKEWDEDVQKVEKSHNSEKEERKQMEDEMHEKVEGGKRDQERGLAGTREETKEKDGKQRDALGTEMYEKKWDQLNAHGKRKEYKRARKVIESLR